MVKRLKPQYQKKPTAAPNRRRPLRINTPAVIKSRQIKNQLDTLHASVSDGELRTELDLRDTLAALNEEIAHLPKGDMRDRYIHAMTEVAKDGNLEHLVSLTRYVREPVPLDEFLYSHTYLGIGRDELFPGVVETLEALEDEQYVECVMKGAIGGGKALNVATPILTERGWSTMGALRAGDRVYDEQGNLCTVVKAHEPYIAETMYRVHFSDETYIDADGEHLWYTDERTPNGKKKGSIKDTQYIAGTLRIHGNNAHSIPLIQGVQSIASDLVISPYTFGAWLGDGNSDRGVITIDGGEGELIEHIEADGYYCEMKHYEDHRTPRYGLLVKSGMAFNDAIRDLDVRCNKHIPWPYLYGSHEQRVALLQGLMDTDGYIRPTGSCEITQKNRRLADDIMQLLWLLGLKPLRREKIVKGVVYHRITFTAHRNHVEVFRLRRKLKMQPSSGAQALRQRSRTIVAVEPIDPVKVRCITVDSPNRLYCAGHQMQVTHNTTTANLGMARQIYKISCMRNPQQTFGIQQHSSIVFTIQSVRLNTAKQAVFEEMGKFFNNSPYFREIFPYDRRITSQMRFLKHNVQVMPVSSSASGAISMNVIGGLLDEVNFMQKIKDSKQGHSDENGEYNQAKELYLTLSKRRRSRFMHKGKLPGTLFLVSSSRYPDDFTEEKAAEAAMYGGDDPEIYVYSKSLWESKGRERYAPENFTVLVGNERTRSRILGEGETVDNAGDDVRLIEVPEDFRGEFEKDIEGSIRDFAGQTTLASHPFIHNRESVFECMELADEYAYTSAYPHENVDLSISTPTAIDERLRLDVNKMRVAHADLATTGDSAGLAIGHIAGTKTMERVNPETKERTVEVLPVIAYDVIMRIDPPRDGEIDFSKIRQMIIDLRDNHGLPIKVVTTDGFQCVSGDTQIWTNRGMIAAKDVKEGDVVQSRIGPRPVTKKWSFGTKPALRITTKDGHSITVTDEHKLEVSSQKRIGGTSIWKWKKAKDMEVGDILHTWDGNTEVDAPDNGLTPSLAKLYGLIYGDGTIGRDGVCIHCAKDEINEAARIVRDSGCGANVSIHYGNNTVRFSSRDFVRDMLSDGFDKHSIPEKLKEAPISVQSAFLSGLFAADGSVKERDGQPSLSTKHAWLADYVQNLLRMAHGIATHRTNVDRREHPGFDTSARWHYIVSIKGSRRAFHDKVGFAYETKQSQLARHLGVQGRRIGSAIASIVRCEANVYDFEVEEDHAYLANGIVSHNSTDFRQILAKKGFVTDYLSLDRTTQPYRTFRDALYDRRILLPRHQTLVKELTELEILRKNNKEKVDHKPRGSKDVADAVCGVAAYLLTRRQSWTTQPTFRGRSGLMLHGSRTGMGDVVLDQIDEDEFEELHGSGRRSIKSRRSINRLNPKRRKVA